jgi:hypothetical protein
VLLTREVDLKEGLEHKYAVAMTRINLSAVGHPTLATPGVWLAGDPSMPTQDHNHTGELHTAWQNDEPFLLGNPLFDVHTVATDRTALNFLKKHSGDRASL